MRGRSKGFRTVALLAPLAAGGAFAATAPVPVTMEEVVSLPQHTVYRPTSLAVYGVAHTLPVIVWGNGGCVPAGNSSAPFLNEIASHGYLVIASGPIADLSKRREGPPPAPRDPNVTPGSGGPPPGAPGTDHLTTTAQLTEALDWAVAENKRPGSAYQGKLDILHSAAMGTSCGGLQAIEIGPDPRIKTVATWSSGLLDTPRAGANATRDELAHINGPVLYVVGDTKNDGANQWAHKDYSLLSGRPVVLAVQDGAAHGQPLGQPGGGAWGPIGVAWLDWTLKGDKSASRMFIGTSPTIATMPGWQIMSKGF